jgi:alpha-mannosidase
MLEKEEGTWALQNSAMYKGQEYGIGILNKGIPGYSFQGNGCRLTLFRSVSLSSFSYVVWLIKNLGKIARPVGKSISNFKNGLNVIEYPIYPVHNVILREWATEGDIKCFGTTDLKSHILAFSKVFKEALCWERGKHSFEYSILMDVRDTKDVIKEGLEINNPLWLKNIKGTGDIDKFLMFKDEIEGVVVSGMHPIKDGLLLRCHEIEGKKKEVYFPLNIDITKVYKFEYIDGNLIKIPLETNSFSYEFKPWEITNFLLVK